MSSSACSCSSLVCAPWQKTRPNRKRRPFTPYCFPFFKSVLFCSCCLSRGKEVATRPPAIAHCRMRGSSAGSPWVPRVLWSRALFGPPAGAIPSPPAGCLVPGLPLPQARRSREITPPDRRWLNARRPASDSMPAGPPLTQCPPDRRWLKPAGSPLTQARRIGADSCPLAAANPSPMDQVHMSRPGVPCVCFVVPTGTF